MLEARASESNRHIGACSVKLVSSLAKREQLESLGVAAGNQLRPLAQL